jgi:carbon-monoxide dehydrogenase small subunit
MKIQVYINEAKVQLEADPDSKLLAVLRQQGLTGVKCGCLKGLCGACTVLLNNIPVPSCLIPIAAVRDAKIVTLEHFEKTDFYADIKKGFSHVGIHLCGLCDAGKIFMSYQFLAENAMPNRTQVYDAMSQFACYCTDTDTIVKGVLAAVNYRREREKKGGQK